MQCAQGAFEADQFSLSLARNKAEDWDNKISIALHKQYKVTSSTDYYNHRVSDNAWIFMRKVSSTSRNRYEGPGWCNIARNIASCRLYRLNGEDL